MHRYCRDCRWAIVTGLSLGEPICRCACGIWGPEAWPVAVVAPACGDFEPAGEQPGSLDFWSLAASFEDGQAGIEAEAPRPAAERHRGGNSRPGQAAEAPEGKCKRRLARRDWSTWNPVTATLDALGDRM